MLQNVAVFSFGLIPIAIGVSVLRYHLFDIDVVINRALLVGALAVFITVVYVAVVVGVGALVGSRADPMLSAAAAAIVALAFQPVRRRAQRFADRLVYGERAAPYEVLSEFSERLGNAYANEDLLPRMARALAGGTGAARADVWVRIGDQLVSEGRWPQDAEALPPIAATDDDTGEVSATEMREPIRHQGELLGALSIVKRPGESITPTEDKLVRDLAAQAGLVMRNVALTEQLMDNIEQLRASRQRLVHAQDEERRKLERNLHDGAQQQLVALSVKLRLAEGLVDRDCGEDEVDARRPPDGDDAGDRGPPRPRARDLPAAPGGQGVGRCARGAGAQGCGRHVGGGGERRAVPAAGGGGRLLLRARGAQQRGEVLGRRAAPRCDWRRRTAISRSRSPTTERASTAPARATARACAGWRTVSRRSAACSRSGRRRARARRSPAQPAVAVPMELEPS